MYRGARDPGEVPGVPQPLARHNPHPRAPGVGGSGGGGVAPQGIGLLLWGLSERCPALGGDPAGDEHLHESHWPHSTRCRWTLNRTLTAGSGMGHGDGAGAGLRRGRGGASEGAGPGLGGARVGRLSGRVGL